MLFFALPIIWLRLNAKDPLLGREPPYFIVKHSSPNIHLNFSRLLFTPVYFSSTTEKRPNGLDSRKELVSLCFHANLYRL